jgi:hypothetical protein
MQNTLLGKTKASQMKSAKDVISESYKISRYNIQEYAFADGINGDKNSTSLVPSIERILQEQKDSDINAMVLFSDGWFKDTDLRIVKNLNIPIYCVIDTTRNVSIDLAISEFRHNKQGYRNEPNLFEVDVKSTQYKGKTLVQFFVNGSKINEKSISFQNGLAQSVAFDYRFPKTGLQKLEAKVVAQEVKETSLWNNSYASAIDILNDKEQILLITDAPNWDSKFIIDSVKENNRLEVLSYTAKSKQLYLGEKKSAINNWDNITSIVLINQGSIQLDLTTAGNIIKKVKQGTGLLYMGLPISELAEVLPLRLSNIKSSYQGLLKFSPTSGAYSAFQIPNDELTKIPPVDYYYLTHSNESIIIASMDNTQKSPAIALSNQNNGKVVSFAFLSLWKWQMQSKSQAYKTFISDLITWLRNKSSSQFLAMYEPSYLLGDPIEFKLIAVDELRKTRLSIAPKITIFNEKMDSVYSDFMVSDNDNYKLQVKLTQPGQYSFRISDKSTQNNINGRFLVHAQNTESRDIDYNLPMLSWLAAQTGGRLLNMEQVQAFKPIEAVNKTKIERKENQIYKKWYFLSLFILIFCLELFLRRRWGLL